MIGMPHDGDIRMQIFESMLVDINRKSWQKAEDAPWYASRRDSWTPSPALLSATMYVEAAA